MRAIEVNGSCHRILHFVSFAQLQSIIEKRKLHYVAYWPITSAERFIVYGNPTGPSNASWIFLPTLAHRFQQPDQASLSAACSVLRNHPEVWYTPLRESIIRPTPNQGTTRTQRDIAAWIDSQIDVFTKLHVAHILNKRNRDTDTTTVSTTCTTVPFPLIDSLPTGNRQQKKERIE
jgi:hypothetical protein